MDLAESLNLQCLCTTLEPDRLDPSWAEGRPHLFSATPVFISAAQGEVLAQAVAALHRVTALPGYRAEALARQAALTGAGGGPEGVFMGYDFHLTPAGPRLIEVNTNAGGAYLHAAALQAHRTCCTGIDKLLGLAAEPGEFGQRVLRMFAAEWRGRRGNAPLRTAVIVDSQPSQQYLAPEFELARRLFERHGIASAVADPSELAWRDGRLWHPAIPPEVPVDLVYNRLTDFTLSEPGHTALRQAWVQGGALITPDPRAHALHADKRNLILLGDDARLAGWGASAADRALLQAVVPRTVAVAADNAGSLWARRRQLFFKPAAGFGSRGAYRGDKLTRRVWDEIVAGGYVAQDLVPPSERAVRVDGGPQRLKVDVRAYAYAGEILLLAARTWSGQTTNFRTPGGGFAPVAVLPALPPPNDTESLDEAVSRPCAC